MSDLSNFINALNALGHLRCSADTRPGPIRRQTGGKIPTDFPETRLTVSQLNKCTINVENAEPLPTRSGELPEYKIHRLFAGGLDHAWAGLRACDVEEVLPEQQHLEQDLFLPCSQGRCPRDPCHV